MTMSYVLLKVRDPNQRLFNHLLYVWEKFRKNKKKLFLLKFTSFFRLN
jgi:hypothetical protein